MIEARNLSKIYRDFWGRKKVAALKALDIEVRQGEIFGLLGLNAKISRKSGKVWNAISLTKGWTLERQNAAGEYVSEIMREQPGE